MRVEDKVYAVFLIGGTVLSNFNSWIYKSSVSSTLQSIAAGRTRLNASKCGMS